MVPEYINILTAIAAIANLALGAVVFLQNPKRPLNIAFACFSLITGVWIFENYVFFGIHSSILVLQSWYVTGAFVIPSALIWLRILTHKVISLKHVLILMGVAAVVAGLAFVPNFAIVDFGIGEGGDYEYVFGKYFDFYSALFMLMYAYLVYSIVSNMRAAGGDLRRQLQFILVGVLLFGIITMFVSFILPLFGFSSINAYDAQSSIFFVLFSTYAVLRHGLFDVKVIATEIFAFSIWLIIFLRFLVAETMKAMILEGLLLVGTIVFGLLLVRSVKREVENREKGERLARYLANANARLRELDKQKTEFVSIASHQLRGPIAAIKGYTSLMHDGSYGKVPKNLTEPISRIFESGKRISIMVDDFLNVTRIEQGRMEYNLIPVEINKIVRKGVEELRVIAEQNNVAFTYDESQSEGVFVDADESKLAQVFSNLIDNAIKYTTEGSIRVESKLDRKGVNVLVSITDTGIGIAEDELHNLFQKFNRASNANTVSVYGAGLGLYIAKEMVRAHSGWIHIHSPGVGKGTTFTVELPVSKKAPETTT